MSRPQEEELPPGHYAYSFLADVPSKCAENGPTIPCTAEGEIILRYPATRKSVLACLANRELGHLGGYPVVVIRFSLTPKD